MSVTITNDPNTLQGMSTTGANGDQTNFFSAVYGKPSWETFITGCAEKYNLPQILNFIGEGTHDTSVLNWAEEGSIMKNYTIASSTGAGTSLVELTLDETDPYFSVGDYIMLPSTATNAQKLAQVKEIALSPNHVLTIEPVDGVAFASDSIADGKQIMWIANVTAPCGDLSDGRRYKPNQKTAVAQIVSQNKEFCYDEESKLSWVGGKYFYSIDEKTHVKEFNLGVSNMIVFGQATQSTTTLSSGAVSGNGIIANIMNGGTVGTWAGTIAEADLQDICTELVLNSPYDKGEWLVLGGATAISSAKKALKDYFVTGGAGSFTADRQAGKAGFNVSSYTFNDAVLQLHNFHLFNQTPANSGSGGIDYKNALLFLNITKDASGAGTQIRYIKGHLGEVEKMIMSEEHGHSPANKTGIRSNRGRCFERGYSSKFLLQMKCLNAHGFFFGV